MNLPAIVYVLLAAAVLLVVVSHTGAVRRATREATRSIWCPVRDSHMVATLRERVWDGQRLDVRACSAFSPADAVTCGKACLRITRRPASRPGRAWWPIA